MKLFGYEFSAKKVNPEPEVVDADGKVVNKPTAGEKIFGAIKTVAKVGVATGVAFGAYKLGEVRTVKAKNDEINKVNKDRLELWEANAELEEKLQAALSDGKENAEESETDEDDVIEVTTF